MMQIISEEKKAEYLNFKFGFISCDFIVALIIPIILTIQFSIFTLLLNV